jgi:hypothetical protein
LCDEVRRLGVEADDHVGEMSGFGGASKATTEPVTHHEGGSEHRRREADPEAAENRAATT